MRISVLSLLLLLQVAPIFAQNKAVFSVQADRARWFEKMEVAHMALWWVPVGAMPTAEEGRERLLYLRENGESEWVFTFKSLR